MERRGRMVHLSWYIRELKASYMHPSHIISQSGYNLVHLKPKTEINSLSAETTDQYDLEKRGKNEVPLIKFCLNHCNFTLNICQPFFHIVNLIA